MENIKQHKRKERKKTNKAKLKANNQHERLDKWKKHFFDLLWKTSTVSSEPIKTIIGENLQIKLGNFTEAELCLVLKNLKSNKAAGLDSIPPETGKTEAFNDIILQLCNAIYIMAKALTNGLKDAFFHFPKKEILATRLPTKLQLYGNLPPVSSTIRQRRLRFAGHCWRSKSEIVSSTLGIQHMAVKELVVPTKRT